LQILQIINLNHLHRLHKETADKLLAKHSKEEVKDSRVADKEDSKQEMDKASKDVDRDVVKEALEVKDSKEEAVAREAQCPNNS
jgi:hypothetical protein